LTRIHHFSSTKPLDRGAFSCARHWYRTGFVILAGMHFRVNQITFIDAFDALVKPGLLYSGEIASSN
jgi:hypothetical protein